MVSFTLVTTRSRAIRAAPTGIRIARSAYSPTTAVGRSAPNRRDASAVGPGATDRVRARGVLARVAPLLRAAEPALRAAERVPEGLTVFALFGEVGWAVGMCGGVSSSSSC
jgi:hypothetical protein